MKKIAAISIIFIVIFSCSKTSDLRTIDCSHSSVIQLPLTCNGSICQSDTCISYFGIWKELFLSKNQMTQEYFDTHITICNTQTFKNIQQGISFDLSYKLTIDWFEVKFESNFLIWLSPAYTQQYPELGLPNSTLLTKNQINSQINNAFFSTPMPIITPLNHLIYSSRQEAITVLAHAAGVNDLCGSTLYIQYQNIDNPSIGHPVLTANGATDWNENKCVMGIMDLSTDYLKVYNYVCMIDFCFARGTMIRQNNNLSKPIEKIKPGDKVLSYDQDSKKVADDIVEKVDSVKHGDIIRISFGDRTTIENTYDHPYFVKHKGWCSYKPSLTYQKYNIDTKQLLAGDTCLKYDNNRLIDVRINKITEMPGEIMTYNISRLKINNTFFANGILVSDEQN